MIAALENREKKIAVIGLGYVGLPIALEFARKFDVIGFDINAERVEMMKKGIDPSQELEAEAFENTSIEYTADPARLKDAHFFVIAVPTPVDEHQVPNLKPVLSASRTVGSALKKGDYVVYESTVYPGCTEEDCIPILEELSGLKAVEDFKYGYSPERINPGDKVHTLTNIIKVVSGCDDESLEVVGDVYNSIITAGIYKAASVKVAEAAKVIENSQRDINIAFMNELSIIFDKIGIQTSDVLDAANTKWNFLKFFPGLVGGHCIGVDPYYLTYKSMKLGYNPQVILSGRRINDEMSKHVASKTAQLLMKAGKNLRDAKVLVMGVTFKENVADIRNSKVSDLITELKEFMLQVDVHDPHASAEEVQHEYGFDMIQEIGSGYDAIVAAVNHDTYKSHNQDYFEGIMTENPILVDVKSMYRNKISDPVTYWAL